MGWLRVDLTSPDKGQDVLDVVINDYLAIGLPRSGHLLPLKLDPSVNALEKLHLVGDDNVWPGSEFHQVFEGQRPIVDCLGNNLEKPKKKHL